MKKKKPVSPARAQLLKVVERIEGIRLHMDAVSRASEYLARRNNEDGRKAAQAALSELHREEWEEWSNAFMWGLVVDQKTRDRLKAAAYKQRLAEPNGVSHWLTPDGSSPYGWLEADEDAFREMARRAFAPKEEEEK